MTDKNDQVWRDLSDKWQQHLLEKKAPICERKLCPESFQQKCDAFPGESFRLMDTCIIDGRIVCRKEREERFPWDSSFCRTNV